MNLLNKISGSIFLLSSVLPVLLAFFLTVKRAEIRNRMRAQMGVQALQTIVLEEEDVVWMDDHEIWVNESMFDIHSTKKVNGKIIFTGLYDAEETSLVISEQKSEKKQSADNKNLSNILKCLQQFYQDQFINCCSAIPLFNVEYPTWSINEVQQHYDIVIPPPRSLYHTLHS